MPPAAADRSVPIQIGLQCAGFPPMATAQPNAHVLLIEDDPALGAVTAEVLKYLGHQVVWAVSANDGFACLAQDHRFDAVLLDLGLGAGDGVTLVKSLREHGCVIPPLLVFSAQPIDALQRAATAIGAAAILQKPCTTSELASALRRTLQSSDAGCRY